MERYLIIGNGVAGTSAAEQIRKIDQEGHITIITDEDHPFYYRIRLNEYVSGDLKEEDLLAKREGWYRDQDIDLIQNCRAVGGDANKKTVLTADHRTLGYDRLLMAAGSHSFIPPIIGSERRGTFSLRSINDARRSADRRGASWPRGGKCPKEARA
jgi:nitrite reductase (NADH) large subunit